MLLYLISFWGYQHSHSGNSVLYELKHYITIEFLQEEKKCLLGTIELIEEYCLALVGTHLLSGNDYISSF